MDNEKCDGTAQAYHIKGDGSWWENDAQGIPLKRVCDKCIDAKLACYRPEILTGYTQADVDEPIEPEESW
jgi:hypothetical protein